MLVKKGDTVKHFVEEARLPFQELRGMGSIRLILIFPGISSDHMIFVKQNVIIPHNYTFYELIQQDKQTKGPLATWTMDKMERKPLSMQGMKNPAARQLTLLSRPYYEHDQDRDPRIL